MLEKGLIQVYTTESDQMNFAPIGLSLRAAGQGFRTLITCFSHHELMKGVKTATTLLEPNLAVDYSAIEVTPSEGKENHSDSRKITKAFQRTKKALFSGDFDIVILLGLNQFQKDLIPVDDIISIIEEKPEGVELVFSGQSIYEEIQEKADLVTEMVVTKRENPSWQGNCPAGRGDIEVITGRGKGKTTYCLGKGLLTSCIGVPALVFQFIKSPKQYGEVKAINRIPNFEIKTMGRGFLIKHSPYLAEKHRLAARQAWELWLKHIFSQDYGLLVMDEINIATHHGLINAERVMEMLVMKPYKFDIQLSGRNAHPDIIKASTTTIEMKEIKHPYKKGIKARMGIEF